MAADILAEAEVELELVDVHLHLDSATGADQLADLEVCGAPPGSC